MRVIPCCALVLAVAVGNLEVAWAQAPAAMQKSAAVSATQRAAARIEDVNMP